MRKRTRYLLLIVGFVFFLIFAPIIVLYVRGLAYDFKSGKFVQTGILSFKSDPSKIDVYLNDNLKQKKDGDIKFLNPGEYKLVLKKPNYFDWQKRLVIEEGKVTWANSQNNKLFLLKNNTPKILREKVIDYTLNNNTLVILEDDQIISGNIGDQVEPINLLKPVNTIINLNNSEFYLLYNTDKLQYNFQLFNSISHEITDISYLFNQLPYSIEYFNNQIYFLNNKQLFAFNIYSKSKMLILDNILAFTFQNNNLYYIQSTNILNSLITSTPPFTQHQILVKDIPQLKQGKLFITFNKQILLLADNVLFIVNSSMDKIAENITNLELDHSNSNLSILHSGEFDYFNPISQKLNLVTRSKETLRNLIVKNNIGFSFYLNNSGLQALELDNRDNQNQYQLVSGTELKKFFVYNSEQNIIFLDNSTLKTLEIR